MKLALMIRMEVILKLMERILLVDEPRKKPNNNHFIDNDTVRTVPKGV